MSAKKKKYFEFKNTLMSSKDFTHRKINIYIEPRAYNKVRKMISALEDKLIDKSKIKQGKKSPVVISECFEGKWKVAGPINTPQTHNLIVGGLISKQYENAWKKQFRSMSNVDLLNIKINAKANLTFYEDNEGYKYAMKLLKERRAK